MNQALVIYGESMVRIDSEIEALKNNENAHCPIDLILEISLHSLSSAAELYISYNPNRSRLTIEFRSDVARKYIEYANALLQRRCLDLARGVYLKVIEDYTGSGYAALRQRAQIGIDDVRAAQALNRSRIAD